MYTALLISVENQGYKVSIILKFDQFVVFSFAETKHLEHGVNDPVPDGQIEREIEIIHNMPKLFINGTCL